MVRKIYLEIDVEEPHENEADVLNEFKALVAQLLSGFSTANYKIRAYDDKALLCAEPEVVSRETDFEVGVLKFNIKFSDKINAEFINKCVEVITRHLDADDFTMQTLAENLHLSKPTFYRRIKTITGLSAKDFIRRIKMEIAYQLLSTKQYNVTEVAWKCGYSNARHFSKVFYEIFRRYPSAVLA